MVQVAKISIQCPVIYTNIHNALKFVAVICRSTKLTGKVALKMKGQARLLNTSKLSEAFSMTGGRQNCYKKESSKDREKLLS
jgi:hypothetical protein